MVPWVAIEFRARILMKHEASARVILEMPRQAAWELLQDLSLSHHYVPGLTGTEITTEKQQGVGASRRVYQKSGRFIEETVSEWDPGYGFVIRLHRGEQRPPAPFQRAQFRYRLEDAGPQQTALTTSLNFDMRWGGLGDFLYHRLLQRPIRGNVRQIAKQMKIYYESCYQELTGSSEVV